MKSDTNIKKRKQFTSDKMSRFFAVEAVIFVCLMSVSALGLMYFLAKLFLSFLDGISMNGPFF